MFRLRWQQDQYFATSTTPVEVVGDCGWPAGPAFASSGLTNNAWQPLPAPRRIVRSTRASPLRAIGEDTGKGIDAAAQVARFPPGAARLVEIGLKAKAE